MSLTNLKALPRPKPLFKGIRPYPWLAVHPAGHPHEGRPITREATCEVVIASDGECCGEVFEQQMIDPAWLASRPARQRLAFQEQRPSDPDGTMWDRSRCGRHERAALEAEALDRGIVPPQQPAGWWNAVQAEEPPTSEDLFGGMA